MTQQLSRGRRIVTTLLLTLIGVLSIKPDPKSALAQAAHTGFDPFALVNSYGAFGSIAVVRRAPSLG